MIRTDDLYKEINILEETIKKETDPYKKAMLKASVLSVKLLHNIRTNMVRVMEHFNIEKIKPKEIGTDSSHASSDKK